MATLLRRHSRGLRAGALVALLAAARLAWGHAFLEHAAPRVGSTVSVPPTAITLVFSESVEAAFSHVEILDPDGSAIKTGPLQHPAADTITVALPGLGPGRYTVTWSVVSTDTHPTEGRFTFSVKSP